REFQQLPAAHSNQAGNQAFGRERDRETCRTNGACERVIIAQGIAPAFGNLQFIEALAPDGGPSAPAEVMSMLAKVSGDRSVPYGSKAAPKTAVLRHQPPKRGNGAKALIRERRYEASQPAPGRPSI